MVGAMNLEAVKRHVEDVVIVSDDDIIAAIRAFETAHGRPPRTSDFGGPAMPGFETVRVRFGSLAASIEQARTANPPQTPKPTDQ
jgi:hypothetical protein